MYNSILSNWGVAPRNEVRRSWSTPHHSLIFILRRCLCHPLELGLPAGHFALRRARLAAHSKRVLTQDGVSYKHHQVRWHDISWAPHREFFPVHIVGEGCIAEWHQALVPRHYGSSNGPRLMQSLCP